MMWFSQPPATCMVLLCGAYVGLAVGYGCLIGGPRFARTWSLPSAAALVAIVAIMEVAVRFNWPILVFAAAVVAFVVSGTCYDAARHAGSDRASSVLTDWYTALYPEVAGLATVRDKVRTVHTARWRLVGNGKTMLLLVMWYMLPSILMNAALRFGDRPPSVIVDFVVAVIVLFATFVGMHFVFRSPIRAHIRDFIREQDEARAAAAELEMMEPSDDDTSADGQVSTRAQN